MTVSYTAQVTSCRRFGCFWKLLFRWKGSIYKLLWPSLMVYVMLYTTLSFAYRFLLNENERNTFEKFSLHCQTYSDLIPVSFVLGFYVSIVIKRWWDQYLTIPWPDPLAVFVSAFLKGQDDRARLMRRTIMRYANLSLLLTLRMMCPSVKKRFPTPEHIMEAGFLQANERAIFEKLEGKTSHPKYWLPLVWATAVISRARREGKIGDDFSLKTLIDEINKFRGGCGGLLNFDWISIPLVYTQVVTLAVYTYFTATLMGSQYLDPKKGYPNHTIDLVIPIFPLLQFFFYMGWLLVAESLVNPFGEDDDDFEVNWLIDRNLQISYVIVDEMHEEHPELIKDQYWDQVFPAELPYTEATKQFYVEPFLGSAFGVDVPEHMQNFILLSEQAALKEADRRETTPVLIKRSVHECDDKFSFSAALEENTLGLASEGFELIGSSMSLIKPKWRTHKRNSISQPCSISSAPKRYISEDYQDEVFQMSDLSLASSRPQVGRILSVRHAMNFTNYKQFPMISSSQVNTKIQKTIDFAVGFANNQRKTDLPIASTTSEQVPEASFFQVSFRQNGKPEEMSYLNQNKLENPKTEATDIQEPDYEGISNDNNYHKYRTNVVSVLDIEPGTSFTTTHPISIPTGSSIQGETFLKAKKGADEKEVPEKIFLKKERTKDNLILSEQIEEETNNLQVESKERSQETSNSNLQKRLEFCFNREENKREINVNTNDFILEHDEKHTNPNVVIDINEEQIKPDSIEQTNIKAAM